MESTYKLIELLTPIIQSTIWPLLFMIILVWLRKPIKAFLNGMSELRIKAAGVEASAVSTREQIRAAALLGVASAKIAQPGEDELDTVDIADAVVGFAGNSNERGPARVLWVDDIPSNNYFAREAFEHLGIEFGIAKSTEEAIQKLEASHYDLIISDMGRPPDMRAGYTLLDSLRAAGNKIPFVIFAGSRDPEHKKESIEHGAIGCTNRVDELLLLVSRGLVEASRLVDA